MNAIYAHLSTHQVRAITGDRKAFLFLRHMFQETQGPTSGGSCDDSDGEEVVVLSSSVAAYVELKFRGNVAIVIKG